MVRDVLNLTHRKTIWHEEFAVRHRDRLSPAEIIGWSALGAVTGLALGVTAGALAGDVNRGRIKRGVRRLREQPAPGLPSAAAAARAAAAALASHDELGPLGLGVIAVSPSTVELRGWVPSRPIRAAAARIAGSVPGVERVINSILVRGEDDRPIPEGSAPGNQTA